MIKKLNEIMEKIKKDNPNANWSNLTTGIAVLVLVAVFSYAYFSKPQPSTSSSTSTTAPIVKPVEQTNKPVEITNQELTTDNTTYTTEEPEVAPQEGEKGAPEVTTMPTSDTTTVQKGEGLWDVAKRVCNDAEKYNVLADANGLSIWSSLQEGATLKVKCN